MKFNRKLDYYEFSWDGGSTITRINTLKGEKSVYHLTQLESKHIARAYSAYVENKHNPDAFARFILGVFHGFANVAGLYDFTFVCEVTYCEHWYAFTDSDKAKEYARAHGASIENPWKWGDFPFVNFSSEPDEDGKFYSELYFED